MQRNAVHCRAVPCSVVFWGLVQWWGIFGWRGERETGTLVVNQLSQWGSPLTISHLTWRDKVVQTLFCAILWLTPPSFQLPSLQHPNSYKLLINNYANINPFCTTPFLQPPILKQIKYTFPFVQTLLNKPFLYNPSCTTPQAYNYQKIQPIFSDPILKTVFRIWFKTAFESKHLDNEICYTYLATPVTITMIK